MTYRELTMIEVKEVLRRRQAGHSLRDIARETGLDRKTVRRYFAAADGLAVSVEETVDEVVVHGVAQTVQTRPVAEPSPARVALEPHRERIAAWLMGKPALRLSKVHTLLQREGVDVKYATLRRWARDELGWGKRAPTVRVDDTAAGEEAQVDFALMGPLMDAGEGRVRKLWVLIVTLSFSRYQFVWPTFEQTTSAVCEGLDAAWRFFGGVPSRILPDNASSMVRRAHPTDALLVASFSDYMQARNLFADTARVRSPKDKPRVENQVAYVRESWWSGERFVDLQDARDKARAWCLDVAGARVHGTTREVPREVFERVEKARLQAPPTDTFDVPIWAEAKVHPDHHVQVAKSLYSLPTKYIGRQVRVRADSTTVRIYLGAELIKTHPRVAKGKRSTDRADYPAHAAAPAMRSVDGLRAEARKCGASVGEFADRLLEGPLPWTRMRQGYALVRYCAVYGNERVDAVCKRALDFDVIDVPRIGGMLKRAMQTEEQATSSGVLTPISSSPRFARSAESFRTKQSARSTREDGES